MEDIRILFEKLPDTAIITDAYGYILDYNREICGLELKKGSQLNKIMPGYEKIGEDEYSLGDATFRRRVTPILRNKNIVGYTVLLSDITDAKRLYEQRRELIAKQTELIDETKKVNERLEKYAFQARELSDYEEQLQFARRIHDDSGHAITAIHTICQMCLTMGDEDRQTYHELIREGIEICDRAGSENTGRRCSSIAELLETVAHECRFPIETKIEGQEPEFAVGLYDVIDRICKEAYHNTIDHSLADTLFISALMDERSLTLMIEDNGSFRGEFEKGFGLSMMEENVRKSGGEVEFIAQRGCGFKIVVKWGDQNE